MGSRRIKLSFREDEEYAVANFKIQLLGAISSQFQHILRSSPGNIGRAWIIFTRRHINIHVHYLPVLVQKNQIQVNPAVFHPHAARVLVVICKQHSITVRDGISVHQAKNLLLLRIGDFHIEFLISDKQRDKLRFGNRHSSDQYQ